MNKAKMTFFVIVSAIFLSCVLPSVIKDYREERGIRSARYEVAVECIRGKLYSTAYDYLFGYRDYKDAGILSDYCLARMRAKKWEREPAQEAMARIPDSYQGEFRGEMDELAALLNDTVAYDEAHAAYLEEQAKREQYRQNLQKSREAEERKRRAEAEAKKKQQQTQKKTTASSSGSKSGNSAKQKKRYDPYDVDDYKSAQDFADDKYEEFFDYEDDYEDEDEAYDAAEDYWREHHKK